MKKDFLFYTIIILLLINIGINCYHHSFYYKKENYLTVCKDGDTDCVNSATKKLEGSGKVSSTYVKSGGKAAHVRMRGLANRG